RGPTAGRRAACGVAAVRGSRAGRRGLVRSAARRGSAGRARRRQQPGGRGGRGARRGSRRDAARELRRLLCLLAALALAPRLREVGRDRLADVPSDHRVAVRAHVAAVVDVERLPDPAEEPRQVFEADALAIELLAGFAQARVATHDALPVVAVLPQGDLALVVEHRLRALHVLVRLEEVVVAGLVRAREAVHLERALLPHAGDVGVDLVVVAVLEVRPVRREAPLLGVELALVGGEVETTLGRDLPERAV